MPSQSSPPLRTAADDLLELVKKRGKIAVEEVSKALRMPQDSVQALVDFLVEERVLGIEYKFTTPYIYINQARESETPLILQPLAQEEEEKASQDIATMLANVRTLLQSRQFDGLEDAYDGLLKGIGNGGLEWDKGVHQAMLALNDDLFRTMGVLYSEFGAKSQLISQKMAQARSLLAAKQPDASSKVYDEMSSLMGTLPSAFSQERRAIERDALRLFHEIEHAQNAEVSQKAITLSRSITFQATNLRPLLRSGNLAQAKQGFLKLISMYAQLPQGLLPMKITMGKEIAYLYKSLAIQSEIENLRLQLHPQVQNPAPNQSPRPQKEVPSGIQDA